MSELRSRAQLDYNLSDTTAESVCWEKEEEEEVGREIQKTA
jgi:hypothetical protein